MNLRLGKKSQTKSDKISRPVGEALRSVTTKAVVRRVRKVMAALKMESLWSLLPWWDGITRGERYRRVNLKLSIDDLSTLPRTP